MIRRRALYALLLLVIVVYPLVYIGNYAGDSQVHLVYGERAAAGAFFEFNPGEKSAGVTSPGYMLLIAGFFKIAPDVWVPALIKATNLVFWYGLICLVFLTTKTLTGSVRWAILAALVAGLLPGSAYNSTNGMENGIFAFLIVAWIFGAIRTRWFESVWLSKDVFWAELLLGSLLAVACWFRPEGFAVVAISLTFRCLVSVRTRVELFRILTRSIVFAAPFLAIAGGLIYFHWDQTGHLIPTSGSSRILMSNLASDTIQFGSVHFSPKMTIRLAQYFPLTVTSFLAIWVAFRFQYDLIQSRVVIGFFATIFWVFFLLYSFVFGSVHLSRYLVFTMPALVIMGVVGSQWVWENWYRLDSFGLRRSRELIAALLIVALIGVFSIETGLRLKLDSQGSLWRSMQAPVQREIFSDELFRQLGAPENRPISIALQEVQARYWLDDRFVVRSLDGRIDSVLLDFADHRSIDHIGYLKERQVEFLLDTPNYNRDPDVWSLTRLDELVSDGNMIRAGVTFERIPIDRSRVETVNQLEDGEPRWFTGESGLARLHWFMPDLIRLKYGNP